MIGAVARKSPRSYSIRPKYMRRTERGHREGPLCGRCLLRARVPPFEGEPEPSSSSFRLHVCVCQTAAYPPSESLLPPDAPRRKKYASSPSLAACPSIYVHSNPRGFSHVACRARGHHLCRLSWWGPGVASPTYGTQHYALTRVLFPLRTLTGV